MLFSSVTIIKMKTWYKCQWNKKYDCTYKEKKVKFNIEVDNKVC